MFTGIIEELGKILIIEKNQANLRFWIQSKNISELKIDQSISHNGICLTIDAIDSYKYRVTAIEETIAKTAIGTYVPNTEINIERCLLLSQRIDGHIVQGHVDGIGQIISIDKKEGSWIFTITYSENFQDLIVEKGSIAIDGISLTCHTLIGSSFQVSIIPYTYKNTVAKNWKVNGLVNLEFDLIGKYIQRRQTIINT